MSSTIATTLRPPNEVFLSSPPNPRPWSYTYTIPLPARTPSLQWKKHTPETSKLRAVLCSLQDTLRSVHKHKVPWPADESYLATLSTKDYMKELLQPITILYNQLQAPGTFPHPVECVHVDLGDPNINGVTFIARQAVLWENIPIVLSFPGALFDTQGNPSTLILYAISRAMEYDRRIMTIIVTNFDDMAVFQPPNSYQTEPKFIRISTSQPALALRVVTMAYMDNTLIHGRFINMPPLNPDDAEELLAHGPPIDPNEPLTPDEEVFTTHYQYSDFDEVTLLNDRPRALQFFRWLKHIREHCSKLVVRPGDEVAAVTHAIPSTYGRHLEDLVPPLFPYDESQLPTQTIEHLRTIQRESPLAASCIEDNLSKSASFSIKIEKSISEGDRSISTVYRCRVASIDGTPISDSPSLCLKLFDDRFQSLDFPYEDNEGPNETIIEEHPEPLQVQGEQGAWFRVSDEFLYSDARNYFASIMHADRHVMTEVAAYAKLKPVQGSIVPWFYGIHKFILPDGMHLYGILMEYIEGTKLSSEPKSDVEVSPDTQIALIKSCRHGARVLDVADIAQHDWHSGQIILYTNPASKLDHAIFIDFAVTSQTYSSDNPVLMANYFDIFLVLGGTWGDVWMDKELVWDYYGEPDDWDPILAFTRRGEDHIVIRAKDRFAFITAV